MVMAGGVYLFILKGLVIFSISTQCVLAWRIPGTEEPGGLPSMGSYRVGHN